jgi:hypothetical protein
MSISLIVPSIRSHLWSRLLSSLEQSCKNYKYEVIFCGPYCEKSLLSENIKYIESFYTVPVSIQMALLECKNEFVFQTVDDCVFVENAIDICLDFFNENCASIDIINMRYSEGSGDMHTAEEWKVKNCPEFHLPYIDREWNTTVQPLMKTSRLLELGGLDCRWEYSNHSHHDLIFRAQLAGSKVYHSPVGVSKADWMPNVTGDHAPIHYAQINDMGSFVRLWCQKREPIIDINNYKVYQNIWKRRFNRQYLSYEEMAKEQGYSL